MDKPMALEKDRWGSRAPISPEASACTSSVPSHVQREAHSFLKDRLVDGLHFSLSPMASPVGMRGVWEEHSYSKSLVSGEISSRNTTGFLWPGNGILGLHTRGVLFLT